MFDIKELDRWVALTKKPVEFPTKYPRKVRLEVLAEDPAKLFVNFGEKLTQFIGNFDGYGVVQFAVKGPFSLFAVGAPVKFYTPELETGAVVIPDAVSFTRIVPERARNPELDRMMQLMHVGIERRMAFMQRDMESMLRNAERRRVQAEARAAQLVEQEAKNREVAERAREVERAREAPASDGAGGGKPPDNGRPSGKGGRADAASKAAG